MWALSLVEARCDGMQPPRNEQVKGSIPLGGSTPDQRFRTPAEPLSRCGSCFGDRGMVASRAAARSFANSGAASSTALSPSAAASADSLPCWPPARRGQEGRGDDFTLTTAIALSPSTSGARAGRRTPSPATVDSLSPTLSLKLHQQQASRAAQTRVRSA